MTEVLTGRRRYREQKRLFGRSRLVLQVEYEWRVTFYRPHRKPEERISIHWRYATVEDLGVITADVAPLRIVR